MDTFVSIVSATWILRREIPIGKEQMRNDRLRPRSTRLVRRCNDDIVSARFKIIPARTVEMMILVDMGAGDDSASLRPCYEMTDG